jgi:hypothetical protein
MSVLIKLRLFSQSALHFVNPCPVMDISFLYDAKFVIIEQFIYLINWKILLQVNQYLNSIFPIIARVNS